MEVEEFLIVDIADMSGIRDDNKQQIEMTSIVGNLSEPYFDASACSVYHYNPVVRLIIFDCLIV